MINVKADKDIKEKAQIIAKDLGMPLSTIINAFLKDFVRNKSVYFSTIPKMTPKLENLLDSVEKDIKTGKNMSQKFSSSKEAIKYLNNL